jgi:cysteine desulfurase
MDVVYFDHNATTPLDPRVRDAMVPWLGERFGNPSSIHRRGREAREAVERAREHVAALIGAQPAEIVFTASGTEANNTVLETVGRRAGGAGRIVISGLEHPSIRVAAERLEAAGMELVRVPPGPDGVVPADRFAEAVTEETRLACLMLANNEVGTLQPVAEVARICRERGVPLLVDAVQAVAKIPVDAAELGADYLVLGGHKLHGPLGAAALQVRPGAQLEPLLVGGGQEGRRRASTGNVPALVGLGEAARLAALELPERTRSLAALRDRFEEGLASIPDARIHCAGAPRLPQTSNVAFLGLEGEALLLRLDAAGFCVSTGSACSSGRPEPSATLLTLGIPPDEALASLRVSFGITNTFEEVEAFLGALAREVASLRSLLGARS